MKNILFNSLIFIALFLTMSVSAQDCRTLVLPRYNYNKAVIDKLPVEKLNILCHYAQVALFTTNELPQDAIVYDISDVKDNRTGENLSINTVIDTNTFSFYAYNFNVFRVRHFNRRVYFRTPASEFKYLVMRSANEAEILSSDKPDYQRAQQYAH